MSDQPLKQFRENKKKILENLWLIMFVRDTLTNTF